MIGSSDRWPALLTSGLLVAVFAARAAAQSDAGATPAPTNGTVTIAAGALFVGGSDFGGSTAELTPNTGTTGGGFELFDTRTRGRSTAALQARVGYFLTRRISVEGGFRFARPVLQVEITDDIEDAPDLTAEETLSRYIFDGTMLLHFPGDGRRTVPFVFGGAGYRRELHEDQALVEEGVEIHGGAGVAWWFGRAGVRVEGGLSIGDGGFAAASTWQTVPIGGASFMFRF